MADPTLTRLEDQLGYYERTASRSQKSFRVVKVLQLIVAAAVPVAATAGAGAVVTAMIGGLILVLEGIQALFGWQQNWINYRNTAEALKSEQHLYQAHAGPYARTPSAARLLAERIEALLSSERSGWVSAQLPAGAGQPAPAGNGRPPELLPHEDAPMTDEPVQAEVTAPRSDP